jgi:hypothetical protein
MGLVARLVRLLRKADPATRNGATPTPEEERAATFVGLGLPPTFVAGEAIDPAADGAAKAHVYSAYHHMAAGAHEEAAAAFRAALAVAGLAARVSGVCRFLLAGCLLQIGRAGEAVIELVKAHEAYPDHPGIRDAFEQVKDVPPDIAARAAALPSFYAPALEGAEVAARFVLADRYDAVLRTHPPAARQSGSVKYLYTLAVYPQGRPDAVLYIASEMNTMSGGLGSHFLCVFPGDGHLNLGASDEWADRERFEPRALEVACTRLGVAPGDVQRRGGRG